MTESGELFDALTCDPLDLIERAGEDLPEVHRWPKRMAEMFDIEFRYSKRRGMADDEAAIDAGSRVILLCDYLGGGAPMYLPRGDDLRRAVRDSQLYRRANRDNLEALARESGMTVTALYDLIAREKRLRLRKMQGRLFED